MLVDDDVLVRVGLEALTDWKAKNLDIVAEASGGYEALRLLEQHLPDIVITDMYMPEFDGIQFIREGRAICPDAVFVVLSCHNDVEYIKEAMRVGAYDYLLKSSVVDSRDLDNLLQRIITMLELKRKGANRANSDDRRADVSSDKEGKKELFDYLAKGRPISARLKQFLISRNLDISGQNLCLIALALDNFEKISKLVSDEKLLISKTESFILEVAKEYGNSVISYNKHGVFLILMNVTTSNSIISNKDKMLSIAERLRINIKNHFVHTCSIYVDEVVTLEELPEIYLNLMQEIRFTYCLNYDSVIDVTTSTASIYDRSSDDDIELPPNPIDDVVDYIRKNYRSPISLDELAALSNFSKYHLCRKFKEVTTMSIVNFILQIRIDKAKELLASPNSRYIFEIASEVGFNDTSYFNRIFKKATGFTPNEYHKQVISDTKKEV